MSKLNILVAQLNFVVGAIENNAQRIIDHIQHATVDNIDLVVFPELALCGYPPEDLLLRPDLHRRIDDAMQKIIKATTTTAALIGLPIQENNKIYNSAILIDQQQPIATFKKQLLPNYTVFDEKRYFSAGTTSDVIKFKDTTLGILICEDIWEPEPIQQAVSLGAKHIICINASPFAMNKRSTRLKILQSRSRDNQVDIVYANLVGGQDELVFDGGSLFVNKTGNIIQQAKYFCEDLLYVRLAETSNTASPHTTITENQMIGNTYEALVLGVRDYIHKNKFKGTIIGLSGGIDSALTLAIAYDALGPDNIRVVLMPSRYTAQMSIDDAIKMADTLNIQHDTLSIEPIFTSYLETLKELFSPYPVNQAEENIQARIRGNILMGLSNKTGDIVLTTGNKSELSVGYCTLYGDMAGGFAVIKDVPKTLVYKLAAYRNSISDCIPHNIIKRPPSAELSEDQLDEDSLPPYDILDTIIDMFVSQDCSIDKICETGLDRETVTRVVNMIKQNEYKRRQAPIGIRISDRAYGKDRRYPITSGY